jgi:uncharacterized protein (TIGR03067 family)
MRIQGLVLVLACVVVDVPSLTAADNDKEDAVKKDRTKYEGTWRVIFLEVDGNQAQERDAQKITVINRLDGTWSILVDGKELSIGTSEIDPTKKPKTIDFTTTSGLNKGKTCLGIYEIKENCRKICYASPGKDRPTEFSSKTGSGQTLAIFKREKP